MSRMLRATTNASAAGPLLAFTGQPRDPLTGCYHLGNGHRTYNPVLMRFHSADRLSPFDKGGINAYAYCVGDPVNRHDPSGRVPQFLVPMISFVVNALGVVASGLNFRVLRNIHRSYNPNGGYPGSRSGDVATGTIDLRPPKPTARDWTLSTVSVVSGTAGAALSGLRVAGVTGGDSVIYANTALTLVSLATTGMEVLKLATQNPAFYPIDQNGARYTPQAGFPVSPTSGRLSIDRSNIRNGHMDTRL